MRKMQKISVVIPNYNQIAYLPACFDHVWYQTWPNLEIIVVDGGSTDGTKQWLEELPGLIESRTLTPVLEMAEDGAVVKTSIRAYREDTHAKHPARELKIISFPEDVGRNETYNAGFRAATGEFCTYVVGDDLPHPHMMEELAGHLEATGADLAYADYTVVDDAGRVLRLMRRPDYSFRECFARWFHVGVATLHRTALHERFGLFDPRFTMANDYAWYLKMAVGGARFSHLPRVLYSIRYHGHGPSLHAESQRLCAMAREFERTGRDPFAALDAAQDQGASSTK
ncbi:MAG: glycosyltransferase [Desulfovibrionaceae bacterium]